MSRSTVVIVGRPNVGKSTLFNRLCEKRRALTSPIAGTTRDWLEGTAHWGKLTFQVIDTGGYAPGDDVIMTAVRAQVERWVKEADAVLWVVDGPEGLTPEDQSITRWLRKLAQKVIVTVNKADDAKKDDMAAEFFRAGFANVVPVSASHGRNIDDLLDKIESILPPSSETAESAVQARVALVGRPNVGKSSLLNRLAGQERSIVSDIAGTTRDTIDTLIKWQEKQFLFIDTAGLRSKKSKAVGLEGITRIMSERALDRCEVALLMLDATEGLLEGDTAVGRLIDERKRACVVAVNKWDAVENKGHSSQWFREHQSTDMPFLAYTPVVFISAKTGENVSELFEKIWDTHTQFHREFEDADLEAFFWQEVQNRPYSFRGRRMAFKTVKQVGSAPPTFLFRTNMTEEEVHFSYQRHLENAFRKQYGVAGTPLVFRFRRK